MYLVVAIPFTVSKLHLSVRINSYLYNNLFVCFASDVVQSTSFEGLIISDINNEANYLVKEYYRSYR